VISVTMIAFLFLLHSSTFHYYYLKALQPCMGLGLSMVSYGYLDDHGLHFV
jgi:hypothetical protein